jgi:hypothetical protein
VGYRYTYVIRPTDFEPWSPEALSAPYHDQKPFGHGEKRLLAEPKSLFFGGESVGGSQTYDVVFSLPPGRLHGEVKSIKDLSSDFGSARNGTLAIDDLHSDLSVAVRTWLQYFGRSLHPEERVEVAKNLDRLRKGDLYERQRDFFRRLLESRFHPDLRVLKYCGYPELIEYDWHDRARASYVFGHIDVLTLVSEKLGFYEIEKDRLDEVVYPHRLGRTGEVMYKIRRL